MGHFFTPSVYSHGPRDHTNMCTPPNAVDLTHLYLHARSVESTRSGLNHLHLDEHRQKCGLRPDSRYALAPPAIRLQNDNFIDLETLDRSGRFGKLTRRAHLSAFFGPVRDILKSEFLADADLAPDIPTPSVLLEDMCASTAFLELWKHIDGASTYSRDFSRVWIDDTEASIQIRQIVRNANHLFKCFEDSPRQSPYKMKGPYRAICPLIKPALKLVLDDYPC